MDMDPINTILAAITAGAAATASDAVKDTYNGLKSLIIGKFAGKSNEEEALIEYESEPEMWKMPLTRALQREQADQDSDILAAAQELLSQAQAQQQSVSKNNLNVSGDVKGVSQGDHNTNTFNF